MPISQEQLNRLMAGVSLKLRSERVGVVPSTKEEKRLFNHIESQNIAAKDPHPEPIVTRSINHIAFENAPLTREESGLTAGGMTFDESQLDALRKLIRAKHICLIGAAGTGKTTMVKEALGRLIYDGDEEQGIKPLGIRRLPEDQGPSVAICAFTGIATQVIRATLPVWLHPAVKTIHSLLEYKPAMGMEDSQGRKAMFVPTRHARNKLDHDVIVIDETSMLGLDLWHNLVDALRPNTIIILIGDLNQLKPVADATFFAYALSAGIDRKDGWDIAELTTIHRQKEPEANRIIEGAHAILNGKQPTFDDPSKDPNWRIIGYEIPSKADQAHTTIVQAVNVLRAQPTPEKRIKTSLDGSETTELVMNKDRVIFDPYLDLLLTAGNGYDENDSASFVQQAPLNGTLSRLIEPPTDEHPVYVIDAGRESKRFAVGHRVMATKNESPDVVDRVTNGLTGRITEIHSNSNWKGNKAMFGTEKEVLAFRESMAKAAGRNEMGVNLTAFSLSMVDTTKFEAEAKDDERQASHVISVKYANGAERTYRTAVDVGAIQLAYAMTVHKAQGSQADTVIIVVHHSVKRQLSREWLYTAVTRARRRVIILYTRMGLAKAVAHQQIYGANLREKVNRYRATMESGNAIVRLKAREQVTEYTSEPDSDFEVDYAAE